jgi:nicotinate-nucleotide pyrophosphorylase (carboxylating)
MDLARAEDFGPRGDMTSLATIPEAAQGTAALVARGAGIVSGLPVVAMLAEQFGIVLVAGPPLLADGDRVEPGTVIARLRGSVRGLLGAERTALNFLQRLSGIATTTARFVAAVGGTHAAIVDTRKTTPGWRALEKYAVRCGGGHNHRFGLYDAVLIKDNHLAYMAGARDPIGLAIQAARSVAPPPAIVEVEVTSLAQLEQALESAPDIILLDNMDLTTLSEAVSLRDARAGKIVLEASGGVTLETVASIARTGVERISIGALTHSAPALDIALDFELTEAPEHPTHPGRRP